MNRLQAAGASAHHETQELLAAEVSNLRDMVRDLSDRLATSNTGCAQEPERTHPLSCEPDNEVSARVDNAGGDSPVGEKAADHEPRRPHPETAKTHGPLLKRAAQVSSVDLVCHRDIWEFITGQAGRHTHFRMPSQITDVRDDRIQAALSGRSLIAILICLWDIQHTAVEGNADWALATTIYDRLAQQLETLCKGGDRVRITVDDRAPADSDDAASEERSGPGTPGGQEDSAPAAG